MNPGPLIDWLVLAGSSLGWTIVAGLCVTLYASLTITEQAGLSRLQDRFPERATSIARHQDRWHRLRHGALLAAILCLVAEIGFGLHELAGMPISPAVTILLVLVSALVFCVFIVILPRVLAEGYADLISLRGLRVAVLLALVLAPLARPLAWLEQKLMQWVWTEADEDNRPSHEDEILSIIEDAGDHELEKDERELIKSVFDFGETLVRESMTPRVEIDGLEASQTIADCCEVVNASTHSRLPVYRDTIDNIIGIVHVKDVLRLLHAEQRETPVGDAAKPVVSVSQTVPIDDLLDLLRSEKEQVAIVVDDYGGTAGIVTIEDIIEELVGDIHDEYDNEPEEVEHLPDGTLILDARIDVDEANTLLDNAIPESEHYDSLGGFIYQQLGRIPAPGDEISVGGFDIRIHAASDRRIETLLVTRTEPQEQEAGEPSTEGG